MQNDPTSLACRLLRVVFFLRANQTDMRITQSTKALFWNSEHESRYRVVNPQSTSSSMSLPFPHSILNFAFLELLSFSDPHILLSLSSPLSCALFQPSRWRLFRVRCRICSETRRRCPLVHLQGSLNVQEEGWHATLLAQLFYLFRQIIVLLAVLVFSPWHPGRQCNDGV